MTELEVRDVSVVHAAGTPWAVPGLHQVSLTAQSGDRILVVGGNGSGKSTLLSVLAGLVPPTSGHCLLNGQPVDTQPDRVGLLIQNTRLQLSRPTVREELADMAQDNKRVPQIVRQLSLESILHRRIDELSGGQQRRVGLAGAILRDADLILLDEPLAGLDQPSSLGLINSLESVSPDSIIVVVTHDLHATAPILDHGRSGRVLGIERGQVVERERQ
ncbi:MAG: energy-coupling factor ABC transporter ATP-binding protein [Acidimicrobiia bacterium]|nr:energy-coupling factor ABC transporter ATP-binding protein [Acidimicrobiia bacterium]